jgi:hypothetical protein
MDDPMLRLATFFIVLTVVGLLFLKSWKSAQPQPQASPAPKQPAPRPRAKRSSPPDEIWMQVYDTDSLDEAKKIQRKFFDSEIPSLVYQQGKKDVYGSALKHYGISVPREVMEKAQNLLAKIAL